NSSVISVRLKLGKVRRLFRHRADCIVTRPRMHPHFLPNANHPAGIARTRGATRTKRASRAARRWQERLVWKVSRYWVAVRKREDRHQVAGYYPGKEPPHSGGILSGRSLLRRRVIDVGPALLELVVDVVVLVVTLLAHLVDRAGAPGL